ncbi:MAG: hypothetical protein HY665_07005 [Chloroflexi bacterium]|nr:hypothetical protein [Chloroflexota bacterium]
MVTKTKAKGNKARVLRFTYDLYASKRKAEQDARRYSNDPDWERKVRVVKRTAYTLAWGKRKSKTQRERDEKRRTPIF